MAKKFGMKEVGEDEDWTLYWTDYSVALERVMEMKRYQVLMFNRCTHDLERCLLLYVNSLNMIMRRASMNTSGQNTS